MNESAGGRLAGGQASAGWRGLEIVANAQAAVTTRLRTHGRGMALAGVVPAAAATLLYFWTVEAYWAAIGFSAGGVAIVLSSAAILMALTSLAVGRMVRHALDLEPASDFPRGFAVTPNDLRVALTSLALFVIVALTFALWRAVGAGIGAAFIAPGSEIIAVPVEALARAAILVAVFYVSGRLAILIPAAASGDGITAMAAWRATDGHAIILFLVCLAVPAAIGAIFIGTALAFVGAVPWPGPEAFGRIEALVGETRKGFLLIGLLLFLGFLGTWAFMAAGLACAWGALKQSGAMTPRA